MRFVFLRRFGKRYRILYYATRVAYGRIRDRWRLASRRASPSPVYRGGGDETKEKTSSLGSCKNTCASSPASFASYIQPTLPLSTWLSDWRARPSRRYSESTQTRGEGGCGPPIPNRRCAQESLPSPSNRHTGYLEGRGGCQGTWMIKDKTENSKNKKQTPHCASERPLLARTRRLLAERCCMKRAIHSPCTAV